MTDPAKYIVVMDNSVETVIIFPCWLLHANMAGGKKVVSAGKVEFSAIASDKIKIYCYGESVGLNVKARPEEDAYLIEKSILRIESRP